MIPYTFSSILCVTIIIGIIYAEGDDRLMKHYEGENKCKYKGGLIDYEWLIENGSVHKWDQHTLDNLHIVEGQAIWIHGYAKMSSMAFSWYGCFHQHSINITFENTKCRIHDCFDICSRSIISQGVMFIGISNKMCHCMTKHDSLSLQHVNGQSMCRIVDVGYEHYCPNSGVMNVYKVHRDTALLNNLRQCLSTKKTENAYILSTNTCFSPNTENVVFECACAVNPCISLNDTCKLHLSDMEETEFFVCFQDTNTSWFISRKDCHENMGRLVNPLDSESFRNSDTGTIFWTDMFQTFELTGPDISAREQHWSCLAVTRVGDVLYLDPDDCSIEKEIICSDEFKRVVSQDDYSLHLFVLLSIILAGVLMGIIAVIAAACWHQCKQQKYKAKETTDYRQMSRLNKSVRSFEHANDDVVGEHISEHSTTGTSESCDVEIHVRYRHEVADSDSDLCGQNVTITSCKMNEASNNVQPSSVSSNANCVSGNFPTENSIKRKGNKTDTTNKDCNTHKEITNTSDDYDAVHGRI